jgi:hypothetical protein
VDAFAADPLEHALHDGEVHPAYEVPVLGCERAERPVAYSDRSVVVVGLVPPLVEHVLEAGGDLACC